MERTNDGPQWTGIVSQPNSANLPQQKNNPDNLTVKSKLRKLAELRSRGKEFGSNDSLNLTPLNRSLSDPWLLKSDPTLMDTRHDLSRANISASSSNLLKEKDMSGVLPMSSNGLTSAGSESYVNTLWQQQLELMQKSVNAYQKMSELDYANGMMKNTRFPYFGYNYADTTSKTLTSGGTHSEKALVKEKKSDTSRYEPNRATKHPENNVDNYYAQHPSLSHPSKEHNESTVHWKPIDNAGQIQFNHLPNKPSENASQNKLNREKRNSISDQISHNFSEKPVIFNSKRPAEVIPVDLRPPEITPIDLSRLKQTNQFSSHHVDFSQGQQQGMPNHFPVDLSKQQENHLPIQHSMNVNSGQQDQFPNYHPIDFSKRPTGLVNQYPMDETQYTLQFNSQKPVGFKKEKQTSLDNAKSASRQSSLDGAKSVPWQSSLDGAQSVTWQSSLDGAKSVPWQTSQNGSTSVPSSSYSDVFNAIDCSNMQNSSYHGSPFIDGNSSNPCSDVSSSSQSSQQKPYYPVDNYLNGDFYNLPPPNKEVKKHKKIQLDSELLKQKGDNHNGQFPFTQYPYLPNYYSDPHMMKALLAHQTMAMQNAMDEHKPLKRKQNSSTKDTDKPKVKRSKKVGEKLNKKDGKTKNIDPSEKDQFKSKYLSMDVKNTVQANSEALSQIDDRIKKILSSAASELNAHNAAVSKSENLSGSLKMDVDFLDAHESLLTSKDSVEPSSLNCDNLGMGYSPLCVEKSKTNSSSDLPHLINDNTAVYSKYSAISKSVDNEMSLDKTQNKIERDKFCNLPTDKIDVYNFSDEYSDMKVNSISKSRIRTSENQTSSKSKLAPHYRTLESETSSNLSNVINCKSSSVSVKSSGSADIISPNNTVTLSTAQINQGCPTFKTADKKNEKMDMTKTGQMHNNLHVGSLNSDSKDLFGISVSQGSTHHNHNLFTTSFQNVISNSLFSNTWSKNESIPSLTLNTHSSSICTMATSTSTTSAISNSVSAVCSSDWMRTSTHNSLPSIALENTSDVNFKVPDSAKCSKSNSAISRLENNLLSDKLEDLSELLDTTGNSDDEKENFFKSFESSFEGAEDILHDGKPLESLPESGLDQLAWVADHVQKIKTKVTGNDDIIERLKNNEKVEIPQCGCRGPGYIPSEDVEGPYYTHLGAAQSIQGIRVLMEKRTGLQGKAIRIEKIRYTGKEGKSSQGCPIAKWIIRRSSLDEKYLCVVKQRPGHFCETAVLLCVAVAWEGIEDKMATDMYDYLRNTLTENGFETERRCGTNERKTCACQGINLARRGASFSFGCSWSMYFNGCKFARSQVARKFKLKDSSKEEELEARFQRLATDVAPLYKQVAPDAYSNQVAFEDTAVDCRLGLKTGRPFSGVTSCVDFCAHAHKDLHNMNNGSTVVVTLTKHRGLGKPDDEQLHVLPLYVMDMSDEHGSTKAQYEKVNSGGLEVLHSYQMEARIRATPLTPCRRKKKGEKKGSPGRKKGSVNANKMSSPITPKKKLANASQDSNISSSDLYFHSESDKSNSGTPQKPLNNGKHLNSQSYEEFMNMASQPELNDLYDSFWNYFYSFGSFPPADFMASMNKRAKDIVSKANHISQNRQQSLEMNHPAQNQKNSQQTSGDNNTSEAEKMCANFTSIVNDIKNMSPGFQNGAVDNNTSDIERQHNTTLPIDLSHKQESLVNQLTHTRNSDPSLLLNGEFKPNAAFESPLHLLSEAVSMRTKELGSHHPSQDLPQNTHHLCESSLKTAFHHDQTWGQMNNLKYGISEQFQNSTVPTQQNSDINGEVIDQNILKCEMEYNENAFADPEVGGVAIALSHGSVLFECAKRELHATTGLKNPNRYSPTRISLVFYQHKNLNYEHHGMYVYEKKCERMRLKRMQEVMGETNEKVTESPSDKKTMVKKKKSKKEKEKFDITKTSAAQYKYMWDANTVRADTMTTDSVVTRWIDPQPMITGPYQRWI